MNLSSNGELAAEGVPELSGTRFLEEQPEVDSSDPNSDRSSLNRELAGENKTASKSNSIAPDDK